MPIGYGQVKGRKYNSKQPEVDKQKPDPMKSDRKIELIPCKECGRKKPPSMFHSGRTVCKQCLKRRAND